MHPTLEKFYGRLSPADLIFVKTHKLYYKTPSFNWVTDQRGLHFVCLDCDGYLNFNEDSSIQFSNIIRTSRDGKLIILSCGEPDIEYVIS